MAHGRVVNEGEISLGGRIYRINGQVRRSLASQFPQKLTLGDYTEESNPVVSAFTINDQRGGIGQNIIESEADVQRAWFASAVDIRYRGHMVLGPDVVTSTNGAGQNFLPVRILAWPGGSTFGELDTYVLAAGDALISPSHKKVFKYNPGGDSFDSKQGTEDLGGTQAPTDFNTGVLNGSQIMLLADGSTSGFHWTESPNDSTITWSSDSHGISQTTFWRDMLWAVTSSGSTLFTADLADGFTEVAQFPDKAVGAVRKLFTAGDEAGEERLYAAATSGLWVYNNQDERWERTALQFPYEKHVTAAVWRNTIFLSAGLSLFRYIPPNQIFSIGLDRDDGLPGQFAIRGSSDQVQERAYIVSLESTPAFLYAATTVPPGPSFSAQSGLFRWDEVGWDVVYASPNDSEAYFSDIAVHNDSSGHYRLFLTESSPETNENSATEGGRMHHFLLNRQINPAAPSFQAVYNSSGLWESPWLEKIGSQEFTAHQVIVNSDHPTSSETLRVQYALNYDDTSEDAYATVTTKSTSGEAKFLLPQNGDPVGIDFRAFKFKVDFARGTDNSKSPDLKQISLVFSKNLQPVWQFAVQIDMRESVSGYSPREMRQEVERIITSNRLTEFTYRNEDGGTETHFVKVLSPASAEQTGHTEYTQYQLALVEPVPQAEE